MFYTSNMKASGPVLVADITNIFPISSKQNRCYSGWGISSVQTYDVWKFGALRTRYTLYCYIYRYNIFSFTHGFQTSSRRMLTTLWSGVESNAESWLMNANEVGMGIHFTSRLYVPSSIVIFSYAPLLRRLVRRAVSRVSVLATLIDQKQNGSCVETGHWHMSVITTAERLSEPDCVMYSFTAILGDKSPTLLAVPD